MADDPNQFLQQYLQPGVAGNVTAPGKIAPEDFLSGYKPDVPAPTGEPSQAPNGTGIWNQIAKTLRFVGGKLVTGALGTGAGMAASDPSMGGLGIDAKPENPNQIVFGTPNPQAPNTVARYGGAVAEAAGANPLFAAAMPLATAGGALGGELANEFFPDSTLARITGGVFGGSAAGGVTTAAKALLGTRSLANIAKSLGSSETQQAAGTVLQGHANDWLANTFPQAENEIWRPVDQALHSPALPAGSPVPLTNFEQALDDITGKGGSLKGLADKMQPGLPKTLLDELRNSTVGLGVDSPWDDVRQIRTLIGQGMRDVRSPLQPIGQANLDKMYSAITQDLSAAANANGAGDLFSAANATSTRLRTLAEDNIGPLVAPGVTPEKAVDVAMSQTKKGGTNLSTLRSVLPDEATNELAAAHLLQTPKGWAKLSPEAKVALVPDGAVRGKIDSAVQALSGKPTFNKESLTIESILGEGLGQAVGPLLHLSPGVGAVTGATLPLAIAGSRAIARNPAALRYPVAGGLVAGNDLSPQ